jgi:outer membrane protein OmpA-like peptidoglycan-associated protein
MTKKFFTLSVIFLFAASGASAQGWLGKLKDKALDKVKEKVEKKVENAVDKETDAILEGKSGNDADKGVDNNNSLETAEGNEASVETTHQKSDFVPGSMVMFEDNMKGEQVGEFPSKWDLVRGNAEVAVVNGEKCIAMDQHDCWIAPLMKDGSKNYLGDVFTVEYDMLFDDREKNGAPSIEFDFMHESKQRDDELFTITYYLGDDKHTFDCNYCLTSEPSYTHKEGSASSEAGPYNDARWHHYALSFNKRAIKFYVDGRRVINVPNAKPGAGWFTLFGRGGSKPLYIKNVRVAKGAVELYERQATDVSEVERAIMESGKFVTNNILFETGKATLKSESMAEIRKVAEYMKKNPTVRFEVQGHTDNQGSDAVNDPLSQQRAEAVVKALEGMGCDGFNLRAVGKGSHEPVADNSSDAGRAKNRRVEFIKK